MKQNDNSSFQFRIILNLNTIAYLFNPHPVTWGQFDPSHFQKHLYTKPAASPA